uniref:Methylosome subunit pICln n=1 Tax=Gorilla gorilla gorilla TaxID=9595 RepID=A0A2I2Y5C6_GORGO
MSHDTKAVLNRKVLLTGTLYIADSHLSWLDSSGLGFSLEYTTISLLALSRDQSDCLGEHLYVMVSDKFEESKESVADEEEEDSDDVELIAEFIFVPSDKSALGAMFTAMCECQALHPDPEDEDEDDYDGEEHDVEIIPLTAEGQATLERLEEISQYNMAGVDTTPTVAGQFEDTDVDH